jgi:hypothetical protein
MPDSSTIEQRLSAMERAVRDLEQRFDAMAGKAGWLRRLRGAFNDRPEFDDVVRLGREFRESDRPRGGDKASA